MKKSLTCFFLIVNYVAVSQNTVNYYQQQPVTVTQTYNGNLTRLEISTYDSTLGSMQYFNTDWYGSIYFENKGGVVAYQSIDYSLQDPYFAGAVIYDFITSQWNPILANDDDNSYINLNPEGQFVTLHTSRSVNYNSLNTSNSYYYDIKAHDWLIVSGQTAWGANSSVDYDGMGWSTDGDGYDRIIITHYNPAIHGFCTVKSMTLFCGSYYLDDNIILYNDCDSYYSSFGTFDGSNGTGSGMGSYNVDKDSTNDGLIYYRDTAANKIIFGAYDNSLHQWQTDTINSANINKFNLRNRVIAMADTGVNGKVIYGAYSFTNHQMVIDSVSSIGVNNLTIQSGTITWTDNNSIAYTKGYIDSVGWGNYSTPPQAFFHMATWNSASTGLLIYIKNYSIGADSVFYDFGDGITTHINNPYHLFRVNGQYKLSSSAVQNFNVCQTAYGNGTASSCAGFNVCSVPGTASINNSTICSGDPCMLTLNGYSGNIQWQYQSGALWINDTTSGSNTDTLIVSPVYTTKYRALVTDSICIPAFSNVITIYVTPPANAGSATVAPDTICSGMSAILGVTGTSGTIQWQRFNGTSWFNITGTAVSPVSTTFYRTIANYGTCPADTSNIVKLFVVNLPSNPVITPLGPTTFCSGSSVVLNSYYGTLLNYQYLLNGINIGGATAPQYQAFNAGIYQCILSGPTCSITTQPLTITIPCIPVPLPNDKLQSANSGSEITVHPNPARDNIYISFPKGYSEKTSITLMNAIGEVIYERKDFIPQQGFSMDVNGIADGVYLLRINGMLQGNFKITKLSK